MKIDEPTRAKLREPMPPEAITQHPTKTFLSTIKAIYIVERLNDIFGIGGWCIEHEIVSDEPDYVSMKGRILIHDPIGIETPWQYGGHKKTGKNTEAADGYKSAVTDCQSKCASYLEIGIDVFKGKTSAKTSAKKPPAKKPPPTNMATDDQKKQIMTIINESHDHLSNPEIAEFVGWYGKGELTKEKADFLIANMDKTFDDYLVFLEGQNA